MEEWEELRREDLEFVVIAGVQKLELVGVGRLGVEEFDYTIRCSDEGNGGRCEGGSRGAGGSVRARLSRTGLVEEFNDRLPIMT